MWFLISLFACSLCLFLFVTQDWEHAGCAGIALGYFAVLLLVTILPEKSWFVRTWKFFDVQPLLKEKT